MTDKRYTEDEIRAAYREPGNRIYGDLVLGADELIAELTRPEMHPDVVVTYVDNGGNPAVGYYGQAFSIQNACATNIMPHYPEDKVLEWAKEREDYLREFGAPVFRETAHYQAKMDAFKYGRE